MCRRESTAQLSQRFVIEIAPESDLARQIRERFLFPRSNEFLQREVDDFLLRSRARYLKRFIDELIIKHDVRSHGRCKRECIVHIPYTSMPTARINSSALLLVTTPGRMR